ncbi:his operon leader peptide, partial [Escherichia coli]|nr:his operon leader peptide [Escherichia coli]
MTRIQFSHHHHHH